MSAGVLPNRKNYGFEVLSTIVYTGIAACTGAFTAGLLAPQDDFKAVALSVGTAYLMTGGTYLVGKALELAQQRERKEDAGAGIDRRYFVERKTGKIYPLDKDDKPIMNATAYAAPAILTRINRGLVNPPIPHCVTISQAQWFADAVLYAGMTEPTFRDNLPFSQEQWREFVAFLLRNELMEYRGRGYRKGYRVTDLGLLWAREIHTQYGPAPSRVRRVEKA